VLVIGSPGTQAWFFEVNDGALQVGVQGRDARVLT
jgi:hypothetical protein